MNNELIKALEEQIKMLKDIIISMPGHVYWTDKNGVYLGCNALQAKSAGCTIKDFIGKTAKDMPWLSKNKMSQDSISKANDKVIAGDVICIEEKVFKQDGSVQISSYTIRGSRAF